MTTTDHDNPQRQLTLGGKTWTDDEQIGWHRRLVASPLHPHAYTQYADEEHVADLAMDRVYELEAAMARTRDALLTMLGEAD